MDWNSKSVISIPIHFYHGLNHYFQLHAADSQPNNSTNHSYRSAQVQFNPTVDKAKDRLQRSAQFYDGQSSSGVGILTHTAADTPGSTNHVTTESGSMGTWEEVFEQCSDGYSGLPYHMPTSSNHSVPSSIEGSSCVCEGGVDAKVNFGNSPLLQSNWQVFNFLSTTGTSSESSKLSVLVCFHVQFDLVSLGLIVCVQRTY